MGSPDHTPREHELFADYLPLFVNGDLLGDELKDMRYLFSYHCRVCGTCQQEVLRHLAEPLLLATVDALAEDRDSDRFNTLVFLGIGAKPTLQ